MAKARPIRGVSGKTPLLVAGERMIGIRLDEMLAFQGEVFNPEAVYELHQMRIAAKRLRYTLELFQEAYDTFSEIGPQIRRAAQEVERIQEALGAIHDADILSPQLSEYLVSLAEAGSQKASKREPAMGVHLLNDAACTGLLTVCRKTRIERDRRYEQFLQHWRRLLEEDFFDILRRTLHEAAQEMDSVAISETAPKHGRTPSEKRSATRPASQTRGRSARGSADARKRP